MVECTGARCTPRAPSAPCLKTCTLHVQSAASISAVCSARAKWCRLRRPTTSAQKETEAVLARYRRARSARPKWSAPLWTCKVHPPPQGVHRFARAKWCCANSALVILGRAKCVPLTARNYHFVATKAVPPRREEATLDARSATLPRDASFLRSAYTNCDNRTLNVQSTVGHGSFETTSDYRWCADEIVGSQLESGAWTNSSWPL